MPFDMEEPHVFGADTLAILAPTTDAARYVEIVDRHRMAKTTFRVEHVEALLALFKTRAVDVLLIDARDPVVDLAALEALGEDVLVDIAVIALVSAPPAPAVAALFEQLSILVAPAEIHIDDDTLRIYLESTLYRKILRRLALMARREYEQSQLLGQTRKGLSSFYHDINNPLSILSGNAQFLLEIGRQMGLGDDLMAPLRDVEESSRRLHTELQRIVRLKELIANSGLEFRA
jgi:signal transduction histidine kinase